MQFEENLRQKPFLTTVLHHNEKGYFERYFMGGFNDTNLHLFYCKLNPLELTVPLKKQLTCG